MRWFFSIATFWRFIALYFLLDLAALNLEGFWHVLAPGSLPAAGSGTAALELLRTVPSYLIGAQIGILSVISLALALVTLIAQRDDASTDVQVYYHESLFFEITASCLALVAVLCAQLFWPLQFLFHLLGGGGHPSVFKIGLLSIHLLWFLINLAAVAHFISVTFRFVQRSAREQLRESYTANVLVPRELTAVVRQTLYSMAGSEAILVEKGGIDPVCFGLGMHEPYNVELSRSFRGRSRIKDVHVRIAHWAIRRWSRRCGEQGEVAGAKPLGTRQCPLLWFSPRIEEDLEGRVDWCRRSGGVPLDWLERTLLRVAFRFERIRDAN